MSGWLRAWVRLGDIVAEERAMREVLGSGRSSATPNEPVWLRVRADGIGLEVADGHHRIAAAYRAGRDAILADVDGMPDDEPLLPPFFDFGRPALRG